MFNLPVGQTRIGDEGLGRANSKSHLRSDSYGNFPAIAATGGWEKITLWGRGAKRNFLART